MKRRWKRESGRRSRRPATLEEDAEGLAMRVQCACLHWAIRVTSSLDRARPVLHHLDRWSDFVLDNIHPEVLTVRCDRIPC